MGVLTRFIDTDNGSQLENLQQIADHFGTEPFARQLRLRGLVGDVEVVGNLVPDQLPMAMAAGIDRVMISAGHAARCVEQQWRDQAAKERFGYQRVSSRNRPDRSG